MAVNNNLLYPTYSGAPVVAPGAVRGPAPSVGAGQPQPGLRPLPPQAMPPGAGYPVPAGQPQLAPGQQLPPQGRPPNGQPQRVPPLTVPVAPAPGAAPLPGTRPLMQPPIQQGVGYAAPPVMSPSVMHGPHGPHQHGNPNMVPGVIRPPMGIIGGARYRGGFYG